MTIYVSMSIVLLVGIIPTLAVVNTSTIGGGDTVCVGSSASADRLIVASNIVTNIFFLSREDSVSATETTDMNSV